MPLILASRPALLELVLEGAERLIRGPANGPHKRDAILDCLEFMQLCKGIPSSNGTQWHIQLQTSPGKIATCSGY